MPAIVGPIGRGDLQYAEIWKVAQRLTTKPVKFGTVTPELVAFAVQDRYYKSLPERIMALSDAFNEELHDLADAGCPVIQMEEPQIHLLAARGVVDSVINPEFMLEVFNNTVKGLAREDRGVVPHLLGQPLRSSACSPRCSPTSRRSSCSTQVDADVITFETRSSGAGDLPAIGRDDHEQEDRDRRDRSPHPPGRVAARRSPTRSARRSSTSPPSASSSAATAAWGARA